MWRVTANPCLSTRKLGTQVGASKISTRQTLRQMQLKLYRTSVWQKLRQFHCLSLLLQVVHSFYLGSTWMATSIHKHTDCGPMRIHTILLRKGCIQKKIGIRCTILCTRIVDPFFYWDSYCRILSHNDWIIHCQQYCWLQQYCATGHMATEII